MGAYVDEPTGEGAVPNLPMKNPDRQTLVSPEIDPCPKPGLQQVDEPGTWQTLYGWMLPTFQLDLATTTLKPSMEGVFSALHGVFDEAELALWFAPSNHWLQGDRPSMVMHMNPSGVLQAARADRYVAMGH